jgi:hypothetical protein
MLGKADPPVTGSPRVVNVTTDSEPGWLPSIEQEQAARAAAVQYLATRDAGRAADAYRQLDPINAEHLPLADFTKLLSDFNTKAGAVKERRITTLTWTKNPLSAPAPGIYAAFDLVGRFASADRNCGYIVLRQAPTGGPFRVMREETAFMDNKTAADVEKRQSRAAVDEFWSQLAVASCPNYQPLAAAAPAPLPESKENSLGYATVAAALAGLQASPGVTISSQNGWTVAIDAKSNAVWSFTPAGDAAYPAVVRRQVVNDKDGGASIEMSVLCEASKDACDNLVRTFERMNRQVGSR